MSKLKIAYTKTDEAPRLASYSLLPIIERFTQQAGIEIETYDISLAKRIIASFPEYLSEDQRENNALLALADLAQTPDANIIKLPNISASVPQLKMAIKELNKRGLKLPLFPDEATSEKERDIKSRYNKILGSAVNPVLREGNSLRRAAPSVKRYAKKNPHKMGDWSKDSKTHVASMDQGDFYSSEESVIVAKAQNLKIELVKKDGATEILRDKLEVADNEIVDAAVMSINHLRNYATREIENSKKENLLLSLHLKATMMKVSDPIIFGEILQVYFADVFDEFKELFYKIGINPRHGLRSFYLRLDKLTSSEKAKVIKAMEDAFKKRPPLAMVDADKNITNLHIPSDVIIDASMPAMIRNSGKMQGSDGKLHDTKALIPDRSYAGIYQTTIDFCKEHGAFDPSTMGHVSNVGLMAKKAQEYGSHDKTFRITDDGTVRVLDASGSVLMKSAVKAGDIWRMCQTKNVAVQDWIKLGIERSRTTDIHAIFWLDSKRAHDANLIKIVQQFLQKNKIDTSAAQIMSPVKASLATLKRSKEGLDTISITGNVLRDYLTDLFPILELGTSAKMLSIVPLLKGGGLFETGAGGSAPKHVQQFIQENHLRWDSLGEFLALEALLENIGTKTGSQKAVVLASALGQANDRYLSENKSPSRKVKELDTRGSHFYLAMYWALNLAEQNDDLELKEKFAPIALKLQENETQIVKELAEVQGGPIDIGGHYLLDEAKATAAMMPSKTFRNILAEI